MGKNKCLNVNSSNGGGEKPEAAAAAATFQTAAVSVSMRMHLCECANVSAASAASSGTSYGAISAAHLLFYIYICVYYTCVQPVKCHELFLVSVCLNASAVSMRYFRA